MKQDETLESNLFVESGEENIRIDQLLANRYKDRFSRTYFQNLIEEGLVLLNGSSVKKRIKPSLGDEIEVEFVYPKGIDLTPEPIPLEILYEDEWLLAINNPADMVVHPGPGHHSGTFVNALLHHADIDKEGVRPGIVHRLDKGTTGVLIAAKRFEVQAKLVEAFSKRQVQKEYLAIVYGHPKEGEIKTKIGRDPKMRQRMAVLEEGKEAITRFRTLEERGRLSLLSVDLVTGRTHQIRLHMCHIGSPIVGDPTYGSASVNQKYEVQRQLLHAYRLQLTHPVTKMPLELKAPWPNDFLPEFFPR